MILAFYPGGGGNRYWRMLENLEYAQPNKSYDDSASQKFSNRYLLDGGDDQGEKYILTHCLHYPTLRKFFPSRNIVYVLGDYKKCLRREWAVAGHERFVLKQNPSKFDRIEHYNSIKDASWPNCSSIENIENLPLHILREVNTDFNNVIKSTTQNTTLSKIENLFLTKIHSAYETIVWHREYYNQYPLELSNDADVIDIAAGTDEFSTVMRTELDRYKSEVFDQVWDTLQS